MSEKGMETEEKLEKLEYRSREENEIMLKSCQKLSEAVDVH